MWRDASRGGGMKDWFPFTSYDFYAFLSTGMIVLAAIDRVLMDSMLANQEQWTVAGGVFWAAMAYLAGQIVAIPSAILLELWLARRVLHSPVSILLGISTPRKRERIAAVIFGAREYQPFPVPNRSRIIAKLATELHVDKEALDPEAAFQCAWPHARSVADTATRLDNFLNQYGMCRNVSCACAIAAILLAFPAWRAVNPHDVTLFAGALFLSIGLFGRFIKFYAAFAREVFRSYDKIMPAAQAVGLPSRVGRAGEGAGS